MNTRLLYLENCNVSFYIVFHLTVFFPPTAKIRNRQESQQVLERRIDISIDSNCSLFAN